MPTPPLDDALLQQAVDALARHGSKGAAARALGLERSTFVHRLELAARRGITSTQARIEAMHGHAPDHDMTRVVPSPYVVKGVSSYYNKDGILAGQWVKSRLDDHLAEAAMRAAVTALAEGVPRAEPIFQPGCTVDSLCNLYTFTDVHVGMRSWAKETGADWDLGITEQMLTAAFDYLIASSPPARVAFVNQLGDFLHFDSLAPVTPTSGHVLDADSRYSKVVAVATRILRYIIDKALAHHEEVIVLMAEGNHDMASSVWLRHLFALLYENEPRVRVMDTEAPYYAYVHGQVMLAFHHGHMAKPTSLPMLFAAEYPAEWGATKRRYCHIGHMHHTDIKEHPGMLVTQHPTLAARDAYSARLGWLSERNITAITYHSEHGQVQTNTVVPDMLEATP